MKKKDTYKTVFERKAEYSNPFDLTAVNRLHQENMRFVSDTAIDSVIGETRATIRKAEQADNYRKALEEIASIGHAVKPNADLAKALAQVIEIASDTLKDGE